MSKGTKRGGRTGRFGPRYGTDVRRRVRNVEDLQFKTHRCPQCLTGELKRVSTSVWRCRKCDHKFAGGAYVPRTEAFGKAQAPDEEVEEVSTEFEAELEEDEAEPEPTPAPETAEEPDEAEPEAPEEPEPEETEAVPADEEEEEDEGIESLFED